MSDAITHDHRTTLALTGASGAFGRTLLAQLPRSRRVRPVLLIDINTTAVAQALAEIGYAPDDWLLCGTRRDVSRAADAGQIAITADPEAAGTTAFDVLVEATGDTRAGFRYARAAIQQGHHVVMASKEVESIVGVHLSSLADQHNVQYLPARGDQPANLIDLLQWSSQLDLEVIAAGKASEYDLIFDPGKQVATLNGATQDAPALSKLLELGLDIRGTLRSRSGAITSLDRVGAADYCEMAVVSSYSGMTTDGESMHYPLARLNELPDIYATTNDGGILDHVGTLDVFTMLRLPGEASIAGGVFIVVRAHDKQTWKLLKDKGHAVSRDYRQACIFLPYHLMGIETLHSVCWAAQRSQSHRCAKPTQHTALFGRALTHLSAGTTLRPHGHHHDIPGVAPVIVRTTSRTERFSPFYLMDDVVVSRDIAPGSIITTDDITGYDGEILSAFRDGLALSRASQEDSL